ncbi:MAG: hypothetical protein E7661_00775 [Ruminococcaceae bacterium]|nr:hypothetical protein [Oscillospiraceae bacterium]
MSNRKYVRGEHIESLDELAKQDLVYMDHKVYHRGWFGSWQFRLLAGMVGKNGRLYYAIPKEEKMQNFYVNENTEAVVSQKEFDRIPCQDTEKNSHILLGSFIDKSQARRYLYQVHPAKKECRDESNP